MRRHLPKSVAALCLELLSPAVLAASQEDALATITEVMVGAYVVFIVIVIAGVYFMNLQGKRETPLRRIFKVDEAIHSTPPDRSVTDCVRLMTAQKVGALVVMEGEHLKGIFTERDALTRVLALGRDPGSTKVSEVMTKEPHCVPPTMTVGEAMALVTKRRFRHLPVVEDGRLLAVVSSGDLTRWLVKEQTGEIQELVSVVAGT